MTLDRAQQDPLQQREPPQWSARRALLLGASLLVFFVLTVVVWLLPSSFDEATIVALSRLRTPVGVEVMRIATGLGGGKEIAALTAVVVVGLFWLRFRRAAVFLLVTVAGAGLLNALAKWVVARPRPSIVPPAYHPSGLSFPSGHSMASFAFYVGLWLIARDERSPHARALGILAFVVVPIVGFTRTYLGVHYPTDVLAGWSLSTGWIVIVHAWYARPARC